MDGTKPNAIVYVSCRCVNSKKKIVFAGIIGRSLVQKIHKNTNNLISSRIQNCAELTQKNTKTSCSLGENAHVQKVPQDNH